MSHVVHNVRIPYVAHIDGGFPVGRMVRIRGTTSHTACRFSVSLQCGGQLILGDDVALQVSARFTENQLTRNSLVGERWGPEECDRMFPLLAGQPFELLILCQHEMYKIAVNGQHFTDYIHRIPYERVTHLTIEGDVFVDSVQFEGGMVPAPPATGYGPPVPGFVPPPPLPAGGCPMPYPPVPVQPPPVYMAGAPPYQPPSVPCPPAPGHYAPGVYGQQQGYPTPPPGYPPPPPGYVPTSSQKGIGGMLDKAGSAIGGLLGTRSGHHGGKGAALGLGGTALGAGLAGAALSGHLSPKKALKKQSKMAKKAVKYGLPVAGVGLGAYALSRGFHGRSSSSSSSSSEEE